MEIRIWKMLKYFFLVVHCIFQIEAMNIDKKLFEKCAQSAPLGMISGEIHDWQITASSTFPQKWDNNCQERYARIYEDDGQAWCANYKSSSEWLQVDLGIASRVTGVMTQGRGDGYEWVTSFMVSYSTDAFNWQYVSDQYGNQRVFEGNADSYTVKHAYLDEPIYTRFIKFHTVHWEKHPSMRVEIIGCQVCNVQLAVPPYGKMTASSFKSYKSGSSCLPDDGFIISNKAWCARQNNANQWLQVDIGPPTIITGLVTKGRGDSKRKHWVTRFRISYSNDSKTWFYYKDADHLEPKEFGGNVDKTMERFHYLNTPFTARYIRFHPMDWHQKIGMRAGVLGCPFSGKCAEGFMQINEHTPCIENMAFKKESWVNNKRQFKRHIGNGWLHGHANRAVDGKFDRSLQSCTTLDSFYVEKPIWMVDLGTTKSVSGVMIFTWQGKGEDNKVSYKDYLHNLDKIVVYLSDKYGKPEQSSMCGFMSRLNGALYKPQIHIQCSKQMEGQYLYVEAWGVPNRWINTFSVVLCEVMIYS